MDLELRKTYLGGTDLSVISGLSPHGKPGDVWLEKMGKVLFEGNAATEWGKDLEPVIAMRHARRFGVEVEELPLDPVTESPMPIFHKEFPFIAANPDRLYKGQRRVLECKSAGEDQLYGADSNWGQDGEENAVPVWYLGQTNHYIGILEYDDGFLSSMFLGKRREHRDYPITFDAGLYDLMIDNGVRFWRTYVEPRVQPPVEMFSTEVVMKAVALRALSKECVLQATPEIEAWAAEYRELSTKIDELKGQKQLRAAHIAQWITEQGGTKVKHGLGSFSFKRGEAKPGKPVTNFEAAWAQLVSEIPALDIPDHLLADLMTLAGTVRAACTTTPTSEPSEPVLRPYWAK